MDRRTFSKLAVAGAATWATTKSSKATAPDNRSSPDTWNLWRCAPISFPTFMQPQVPELSANQSIDLGKYGADLVIVVPDAMESLQHRAELSAMVRMAHAKVPKAAIVPANALSLEQRTMQLLIAGTPTNNSFAKNFLAENLPAFLSDIPTGGYRIQAVPNPYQPDHRVILALGTDMPAAISAAAILAYSLHPEKKDTSELYPWPVTLPEHSYWSSFEAKYLPTPRPESASSPTSPPNIPFGVRIWGSPMPTLESFTRLIEALKPLGIDTVAIQGGGWPDLPNGPELYRSAVDIAWRHGIYTIVYVGNEMAAHRPAPLTSIHKEIVLAIKDHPGLLQWHLYNQLAANLSADEEKLVEDQTGWLTGVSKKPVGVEIVWGHDTASIPAEKVRLIQKMKSWGITCIANDDAPIGGWSRRHDLSIWEPRLRELGKFGLPMTAVLQAHVPFVDPTIPTAAQVRSQFWWAVAGGAKGFLFETAYLFTDLSMRGLLSWDLRPLPDGRFNEVQRLAGIVKKLNPMLLKAIPEPEDAAAKLGLTIDSRSHIATRVFRSHDAAIFLLLINQSTEVAASAEISMRKNSLRAEEVAPGTAVRRIGPTGFAVELEPGGGVCIQLHLS